MPILGEVKRQLNIRLSIGVGFGRSAIEAGEHSENLPCIRLMIMEAHLVLLSKKIEVCLDQLKWQPLLPIH